MATIIEGTVEGLTVEPTYYFARIGIDTLHRRLHEFSARIGRRYAVASASSMAVTCASALIASNFAPDPLSMFWCGAFSVGFVFSFIAALYCGIRALCEKDLATVDHVVDQIVGKADCDRYTMSPVSPR